MHFSIMHSCISYAGYLMSRLKKLLHELKLNMLHLVLKFKAHHCIRARQ